MRCVCIIMNKLWKDARAVSVHVRHASVEVQVHCVNVVIGVVLGELLVVRVVPIVVCDDAVVRRTLVLIAVYRSHCFHVNLRSHFPVFGGIVFTPPVGDNKLLLAVTEFRTVLQQMNSENHTSNK